MSGFLADEGALHQRARDACGLEDFGDGGYLDGLRTLLGALDEEAQLSPIGEIVIRGMIVDALKGRLFSESGFAAHPDSRDTPIDRPLVIIGLPRTGTTALHQLLSQHPALQGLELWLSETPKARPPLADWPADPQFQSCERRLNRMYERSPEMKAIHAMSADGVDECWRLLGQDFAHSSWEINAHIPSYSRWWTAHDMRPVYQRHRRNLQLIGHLEPDRRWLLKDPTHLFALDAFLQVYPDARVVQTHRDPVQVIPSVCSLCWSAREPLNEGTDRSAFGDQVVALWERAIAHTLSVRRKRNPEHFYDLPFEAFTADPLHAIRELLAAFDLPNDEEALAGMRAFRAGNPPGKHGAHRYALSDWGLEADAVRERFRDYSQTFGFYSPNRWEAGNAVEQNS